MKALQARSSFPYRLVALSVLLALELVAVACVSPEAASQTERRGPVPKQWPRAARVIPSDVELLRDVEFGKGGGRALTLHILRPKKSPDEPMPVVVFIHGGGWRKGDKNVGVRRLIPLAQSGYFCATIEYRLTPEACFPAQIEDCKCAIRFLRAKAKDYNLDPDRIGVWGTSAGGHLVALLGTSGGVNELEGNGGWEKYSSSVNAVCDWYGPTDLIAMAESLGRLKGGSARSPEGLLIGGSIGELKEQAVKASPVTYVSKDDPPFLIMHGDKDPVVPVRQSESLHEKLKKAGVDSTLHIVKGAGHGFPRQADTAKMANDFFDKHLRH